MRIFGVRSDIVYSTSESLNSSNKKYKDFVVSGRVIRERIYFLGMMVRQKYVYQTCCPKVSEEDVYEYGRMRGLASKVELECKEKIASWR